MQISQRQLEVLRLLEPRGKGAREIVVPSKYHFNKGWRPYVRDQLIVADSRVERADQVRMATVIGLLSRHLVSEHHVTLTEDVILRINERGRGAVRQGGGQGLEYHCPLCFGLIAPSFQLHDCPGRRL